MSRCEKVVGEYLLDGQYAATCDVRRATYWSKNVAANVFQGKHTGNLLVAPNLLGDIMGQYKRAGGGGLVKGEEEEDESAEDIRSAK